VDAEALFLDERVVADRVELQTGGECDRPERAVQRERDVIGFGIEAIFRHSGDAARV